MLKVVVFDSGWGGEIIGDYLEAELPIEVEKIIDWRHGLYNEKRPDEIRRLAEEALRGRIEDVNVVVLAEPIVAIAAKEYLEQRFPKQIFVAYGEEFPELLRRVGEAMILTSEGVKRSDKYKRLRKMWGKKMIEPECDFWVRKIEDDMLSSGEVAETLGRYRGVVVIYQTSYIDVESKIKEALGGQAHVVDMKRALLRDVCLALGLRGVDGRPRRDRFKMV